MIRTRFIFQLGWILLGVVSAQGTTDGSSHGGSTVTFPTIDIGNHDKTTQPTTKPPLIILPPSFVSTSGNDTSGNGTKTVVPSPTKRKPTNKPPAGLESGTRPAKAPAPPELSIDRSVASEYGTKSPSSGPELTDAGAQSNNKIQSVGNWLVPAIIAIVVIIAVVFVIVYIRKQRNRSENEYDARDTFNFFEPPLAHFKDPRDSGWQEIQSSNFGGNPTSIQPKTSIITTTTGSPDSPHIIIGLRSESECSRPTLVYHDSQASLTYSSYREGTSIAL